MCEFVKCSVVLLEFAPRRVEVKCEAAQGTFGEPWRLGQLAWILKAAVNTPGSHLPCLPLF